MAFATTTFWRSPPLSWLIFRIENFVFHQIGVAEVHLDIRDIESGQRFFVRYDAVGADGRNHHLGLQLGEQLEIGFGICGNHRQAGKVGVKGTAVQALVIAHNLVQYAKRVEDFIWAGV